MKKVVFSFDDGRLDTYLNAYQILKKYNLTCTINITTSFVENDINFDGSFLSAGTKSMSINNIIECYNNGIEIACHGDNHKNDVKDIRNSLNKLKKWGINEKMGFASPNSYYYDKNYNEISTLIENSDLLYVRSGRKLKRDGIFNAIFSVLLTFWKDKYLFKCVNKKNIINMNNEYFILPSVTVNKYVTIKQIKYLLNSLKDGEAVILMFHSILEKGNPNIDRDKWYNTFEDFEELCNWLSKNKNINVVTTKKIVEELGNV